VLLKAYLGQFEKSLSPMFRAGSANAQTGGFLVPVVENQQQAVGILLSPAQVIFQLLEYPLKWKQQTLGVFDLLHKVSLLVKPVGWLPGCQRVWPRTLDLLDSSQNFRG